MQNFRFINSGRLAAANNMAIDEALSNSLARQRDFAYLRLYQWAPASLSFGYNQNVDKHIDVSLARQQGYGLVKRMSGGKMVFHNDELTFSLGFTAEQIVAHLRKSATFLEMFIFAIEPLLLALNQVGVPARFSSPRETRQHSLNNLHCYAAAAGHSIFAGEKKLIGAAGIFRHNCLVIHGSIPITGTFPVAEIFKSNSPPNADVHMASLSEYLGEEKIANLPDIIANCFAQHSGLPLVLDSLTKVEVEMADILAEKKYSDLSWKNNP